MAGLFERRRRDAQIKETQNSILTDASPWQVQEAYKALRTNIIFSMPGNDCKVIAFTSAFSHDGKSINCLNCAISFGQIGKKVLLIDCDMRLPTIAKKLGIAGTPGISDILAGEAQFGTTLHKDSTHGIHVLPAGNLPPDPTWLLQSDQMNSLLELMRKYYDYIFIDLPPVTTVTDAAIMSKYVDGYLLIVRHQVTEYRAISDMIGQLRLAGSKIVGFVYNDAHNEGGQYYHRYYRYYSYGDRSEEESSSKRSEKKASKQ
ncbi:MAG: CpsD/CapB family tyrosine-protein kinase [Lachnospiraceae bacterium]|nr:CpsD/CapB family tyrosine-protein kinase [Lachnospiraceae bacterium]